VPIVTELPMTCRFAYASGIAARPALNFLFIERER
jgi:hypothetical protein